MRDKLNGNDRRLEFVVVGSLEFDLFIFGDEEEPKDPLKISKGQGRLLVDSANGEVFLIKLFVGIGFGDKWFELEQ